LPAVLRTKWISQPMHTPWRQITQHLAADVKRAIENLGWRYVSRKGRLGSTFERILPTSSPPMPVRTTTDVLQSARGAATFAGMPGDGYIAIAGSCTAGRVHSDDG